MSLRIFGYGSLVNTATHGYRDIAPARLRGWRRVWRHAAQRPVAFLSVERRPESEILGITAEVPAAEQAALDDRERAYARRDVTDRIAGARAATVLYEIEQRTLEPPSVAHPILLSYIDVVLQGYLALGGPDAVADFASTTVGWHAPVLDDRAAPIYPRARNLSAAETAAVDALLDRMGSVVRPPGDYDLSRLGRA